MFRVQKKNTESKNQKFVKTKNEKIMISSKCTICCSKKKSKFIAKQEVKSCYTWLIKFR